MGYGGYSYEAHQAMTQARAEQPRQEVFKQTDVHPSMNPYGVKKRECRDSPDHPNSLAICFSLDVSGSMGEIPERLARRELPQFMKLLSACGVPDPQILFTAFCDAKYDKTPLQVGQFESTAELMDRWLTLTSLLAVVRGSSYSGKLEGGESYETALWFAARHTALDCWEKRQKKGYLLMTGDETAYPALPAEVVEKALGYSIAGDIPTPEVMAAVRETWVPFFLIPDPSRRGVEGYWRTLFGNDVIVLAHPVDTCAVSAALIAVSEGLIQGETGVREMLQRGGVEAARIDPVLASLRPWLEARG